jgi:hypothetical protein
MKSGLHHISTLRSKTICFLSFASTFIFCSNGFSQTNISGIVNSYYRVVEVIPAKACVRLNTVAGLARLQKTLLIQMKGATIRTNDNSMFGDTLSLNNTGNYEVAIICAINGDSVFMFHNFLNSYTVGNKVQLVKFAEYYSANVIDTVKASAWNNTNGVGGVIALSVFQDLTLNAPINADASGFKGGAYLQSGGTCGNFFYPATGYTYDASIVSNLQWGAYKGEGVFDITLPAQANLTGGRGAPANAGGGGNSHNNGGGGGANLSTGGTGGGNTSSSGCTLELHGLAGKPLKNWNGKKIFFGGGGGAGHSDGTPAPVMGGGSGGGIVVIIAGTLIGNGYKISANGARGGDALSDGASGGGGGGTILMSVSNYTGGATVEAKGGAGGDENDLGTFGKCYGAGGGGSGGAIYFTGSIPGVSTSVTGGAAGLEYGGVPACSAAVLPTSGSPGTIISPYSIRQSTDSASYCLSIAPLPVTLLYFRATTDGSIVQLKWRVANPEVIQEFIAEKLLGDDWVAVGKIAASNFNDVYNCIDAHPSAGINLYRMKIIEKSNSFSYSPIQQVTISSKGERYIVYPNPATNQVSIIGKLSAYTEIKLFHGSGKLIWQETQLEATNKLVIDLSAMAPGVYFLKLNEEIRKLIIR